MIDINKNYETNNRRKVIIYTIQAGGKFPVHAGVVKEDNSGIDMQVYSLDGETPHSFIDDSLDLLNMKEKEATKIEVGTVCAVSNIGDMFPVIGIFNHEDEKGFWCTVPSKNRKKLKLKPFDIIYTDVESLEELLTEHILASEENSEMSGIFSTGKNSEDEKE